MSVNWETTPRGFRVLDIEDQHGESFTVQESSLATERCLWVGLSAGDRGHLTEDQVRAVRDAMTEWLSRRPPLNVGGPRPETERVLEDLHRLYELGMERYDFDPVFHAKVQTMVRILNVTAEVAIKNLVLAEQLDGGILDPRLPR